MPTEKTQFNRIIAGGLAALFIALIGIALTVFGIVSMVLGHLFLLAATIVGVLLICTEIIPSRPPKHKVFWSFVLVAAMTIADFKVMKLKAQPVSSDQISVEVPDPVYVPPRGPGIHMIGHVEPPSDQMCQGLGYKKRTECLCPSPLKYSFQAMPSPKDDNFATRVTINKHREGIYRLRIFARTQMGMTESFSASPFSSGQVASAIGQLVYDPYSLVIQSSAPQDNYELTIHSAEGLRLICINQEN